MSGMFLNKGGPAEVRVTFDEGPVPEGTVRVFVQFVPDTAVFFVGFFRPEDVDYLVSRIRFAGWASMFVEDEPREIEDLVIAFVGDVLGAAAWVIQVSYPDEVDDEGLDEGEFDVRPRGNLLVDWEAVAVDE